MTRKEDMLFFSYAPARYYDEKIVYFRLWPSEKGNKSDKQISKVSIVC